MRPWLLRPAFLGLASRSDFSGSVRVTSEKSEKDWKRRAGDVGLALRMGIALLPLLLEDLDPVARGQLYDRALDVAASTHRVAEALGLAPAIERVHLGDPHSPDGLYRLADLGLVGLRMDDERVGVVVDQRVGLLADHRSEDHVARIALGGASHDCLRRLA